METLENLKKKYAELGKEIERLEKEKKNKRWRAEEYKNYYFLSSTLIEERSIDDFSCIDNDRYNLGNYFKTEEEAQKIANKIKTYIELKQLAEELNGDEEIDWTNGQQEKYEIYYSHKNGKFSESSIGYSQSLTIYCLDKDFLDKALEQIGEERLKELFE